VQLGINAGGFVAELCGSENFAMLSITDRDILHALCERQKKILVNRLKRLVEKGVGQYFSLYGEEYLVPPLHGPKDFEDFNVRYDKPIADIIHEAGGRLHIHSHGSIKKVFQGFLEIGVDVLHPFEPPPMGDITATEAKALARGKLCLEGNIQINRMYESSPAEIRRETEKLIEDVFDDRRGLIVCPTASPYIRGKGLDCLPQFQAAIETVLEYKAF
jgi:uroporphyrinogen-III decarboxylase